MAAHDTALPALLAAASAAAIVFCTALEACPLAAASCTTGSSLFESAADAACVLNAALSADSSGLTLVCCSPAAGGVDGLTVGATDACCCCCCAGGGGGGGAAAASACANSSGGSCAGTSLGSSEYCVHLLLGLSSTVSIRI